MTELLAVLLQAPVRPGGAASSTTSATPPIYGYIPIVIFFLIAVMLPVALLGVSRLVQRRVFEREKLMPYECGVDPIGDARDRFSVRF
ncbi:MAG TPA: NADH-quinone oxidoreductase subunit A, partial [Blastocatellia bacterium]|nr:NADH-quinone oxidoreductase subunit A [Blastocatellia bacterium]